MKYSIWTYVNDLRQTGEYEIVYSKKAYDEVFWQMIQSAMKRKKPTRITTRTHKHIVTQQFNPKTQKLRTLEIQELPI